MGIFHTLARRARATALSVALRAATPAELFSGALGKASTPAELAGVVGELAAVARSMRQRPALTGGFSTSRQIDGDISEPDERSFTTWTPNRIKIAQARAEEGNLREAADLWTAILGDDRMRTVVDTRVRSLLGLDLDFEEGTGRKKKKAKRELEAGEDWWSIFPESEEFQLLQWALGLGVGLGQLRYYETVNGKRVVRYRNGRIVPTLKVWNPRYLRWDKEEQAWKLTIKGGDEITIVPGDGEWILVCPYGEAQPAMRGLWRGLARLWLLKSYAIDDWASHSEVHGHPIRLLEPPNPANENPSNTTGIASTPAEREQLAAEINELIAGGTIGLPPGYKLSLIEAKANTWQVFKGQIDFVNTSAAITVLGQNLSTEVTGGSFAAAKTHDQVRVDLRKMDAEVESTTLHDQGLRTWAALNFGDAEAAPWPKRQTDPPEDKKALAEVLKTVAEALKTMRDAHYEVPPEDIERDFGIRIQAIEPPEEDEPEKEAA